MSDSTSARRFAAVALCWVPAVVIVASWLILIDLLPEEMATQWSGKKTSGYTDSMVVVGANLGVACIAALSAMFVRRRRAVFLAAGFGAMAACVWLVLAIANTAQPPEVGGWGLLTPLAFAYGFIPFTLIGSDAVIDEARGIGVVSVVAETGEQSAPAVVEDAVVSPVSAVGSLVLVAGGLFLIASAGAVEWSAVVLVCAGLVSAQFAILRVRLDGQRLRVRGLIPWPSLYSVDRDQIHDLEAAWISPADWWGWGYRFGGRGVGLVARKGAAIAVHHDGRTVTVNVQRPELFISAQRSRPRSE